MQSINWPHKMKRDSTPCVIYHHLSVELGKNIRQKKYFILATKAQTGKSAVQQLLYHLPQFPNNKYR